MVVEELVREDFPEPNSPSGKSGFPKALALSPANIFRSAKTGRLLPRFWAPYILENNFQGAQAENQNRCLTFGCLSSKGVQPCLTFFRVDFAPGEKKRDG